MLALLLLPCPPSANGIFPTGRTGRRFLSQRYQDWTVEVMDAVLAINPMEIPVVVRVRVGMSDPESWNRDCENYQKAITDTLKRFGVIEDDCAHFVRRTIQEWDESLPRKTVAVEITAWESALPQPAATSSELRGVGQGSSLPS